MQVSARVELLKGEGEEEAEGDEVERDRRERFVAPSQGEHTTEVQQAHRGAKDGKDHTRVQKA